MDRALQDGDVRFIAMSRATLEAGSGLKPLDLA